MDRKGPVAQRAAVAAREDGLHFGDDAQGDLVRAVGPEVEANGRAQETESPA